MRIEVETSHNSKTHVEPRDDAIEYCDIAMAVFKII